MKLLRGVRDRDESEAGNEADRIAADWVARLDRLGGEEADHPDLMRWLEADVRNRGAFARAQALWLVLDSGRGLGSGVAANDEPDRRPLLTRRAAFAGVAASAVAVTAGFLLGGLPEQAEAKTFSTGIGEIKRVRLDDGSVMVLDTASRVETRIGAQRREARLIAGGAWFEVAPGAGPPFVALSNELWIGGDGAAFEFRLLPRPEVLVSRGELSLRRRSDPGKSEYRLKSGAKAIVEASGHVEIEELSSKSVSRLLEWREGGIMLDGETVAHAAGIFNRYNHSKLIVADPELAGQPLVGRFEANRPQDFAEAVALSFDAEVRQEGDTIRIVPREK
ncbi:MAG: DUF4880 domain-containing protein [Sphingomonadales bacterium]|nr:MAG: DUF4880 domain-containing protein [Sphingomonadales bacterium]